MSGHRLLRFLGLAVLVSASGLARSSSADVVIPSSAFSLGRNSAEFHSDVRVFNPTTSPVNFTPVFYDQSTGETIQKAIVTIPARTQIAYDNVLQSLFGRTLGSFGPIRFQSSAALIVSSSVNNVNGCSNASISGQWLPGMDVAQALKAGTLVQLASSGDSARGYRSNLDFVNPSATLTANVTVKIRKGDGTQLSSATLTPIGPNGFFQKAIDDGIFPGVSGTTDTNLWVEFTSDAPVLAFASVIANTSGDPFAIAMTSDPAPPVVPPVAPVASYTVAPASPTPGQAVTFTDTSTNTPTTQLWAFGDGTTATSGTAPTHSYAAAGTFKTAHFVANAAGTSAAVKDVTVAASGPVILAVLASQWKYEPPTITLKVGTKYQITWSSADVIHGIGGLSALGIISCNLISASSPCTAIFTPTANQVGTTVYSCSQTSCGAGHNSMKGTIVIEP